MYVCIYVCMYVCMYVVCLSYSYVAMFVTHGRLFPFSITLVRNAYIIHNSVILILIFKKTLI